MIAAPERVGRPRNPMRRGTCPRCHLEFACRRDGTLIPHGPLAGRCLGQRQQAAPAPVVLPVLGRMLVSPILAALLGPRTDAPPGPAAGDHRDPPRREGRSGAGGPAAAGPAEGARVVNGWKIAYWLVLGLCCWALLYTVLAAVLP